jgi:anionic cell wall polymer biosynthesis LytR-Cps2A-Psr (LCP) family protein
MLPVYVSYFAGGGERTGKKSLLNASGFVLGFTVVFVAMGALAGSLGAFLREYKTWVDMVGGIYFNVPVDMHYVDPTQNLTIDLEAGYQLLDGQKAMQVVRFRQDNTGAGYGDTGRAHTQQEFLKAMLSQVLSEASLKDVPNLVDILRSYVEIDKNLSVNDMIYFGRELVGMDIGTAIRASTLPCEWSSPYMWVKTDEALDTINAMLNPYTTDLTEEMVEFYSK